MTSSTTRLSEQPLELIEQTLSFIDSPKDLLALSCSSKQFYNLIVPHYIEYRHIRCDIRRISLWRKLAQLPLNVASHFVSVEIADESTSSSPAPILPSSLQSAVEDKEKFIPMTSDWPGRKSDLDPECLSAFYLAISNMPSLKRFHWHSLDVGPPNGLFVALKSCSALSDVEISHDHVRSCPCFLQPTNINIQPQLWSLSNFSRLALVHAKDFNRSDSQICIYYSKMFDTLATQCPQLEDLQIMVADRCWKKIDYTPLFAHAYWPQLRRLSLGSPSFPIQMSKDIEYSAISRFFGTHPSLRYLYLPLASSSPGLKLTALPNLRAINLGQFSPRRDTSADLPLENKLPHLEFLSSVYVHHIEDLQYLACRPSLRRLVISDQPPHLLLQHIPSAIPQVEKLSLHNGKTWSLRLILDGEMDGDFEVVSKCQRLTHLASFFYLWVADPRRHFEEEEPSLIDRWEAHKALVGTIMERLGESSTTLAYVEVHYLAREWNSQWVTIKRNVSGVYVGWQLVENARVRGLPVSEWGKFYITKGIDNNVEYIDMDGYAV